MVILIGFGRTSPWLNSLIRSGSRCVPFDSAFFNSIFRRSHSWTENFKTVSTRSNSKSCSCETVFDLEANLEKISSIENRMSESGFWDDQETAQQLVGDLKSLKAVVAPLNEAIQASEDLTTMVEMAEEDDSFEAELVAEIERLETEIEQLQLKTLLNGAHDSCGAILSINARDGVPMPMIGRTCCCGCIPNGHKRAVMRSNSWIVTITTRLESIAHQSPFEAPWLTVI